MRRNITFLLLFGMTFSFQIVNSSSETLSKTEKATKALEYVDRVKNSPCTGGTEELLPIEFDHSIWDSYSDVAIRMANLLTKIIIQGNNTLQNVNQEFLYNLVRNNVDGDTPIFGSGIVLEPYVFPDYRYNLPYAYKKTDTHAHDISLFYNYMESEFITVLRGRDWSNFSHITTNYVTYRGVDGLSSPEPQVYRQPMARLQDCYWTKPYFDCGGGDIWMVTLCAPMFGMLDNVTVIFRGICSIDIELSNIDINQCDEDMPDGSNKEHTIDVFRGTHNCQPTTKCVPVTGHGFVRGAYRCECEDGFYFPNTTDENKSFNGSILENYISTNSSNLDPVFLSGFQCKPCAEGCDVCVDNSPCLYSAHILARSALFTLTLILILVIVGIVITVRIHQGKRPIKSASPLFLYIMITGAFLMDLPILIMYRSADQISCTVKVWSQHIGFVLLYSSLLLKTWRVSQIFKVTSARKLSLPDRKLLKLLVPILCIAIGYLLVWSVIGKPDTVWRKTQGTNLKFVDCSTTAWEYGALLGECLFLLWGAYLSFVVRKAPSMFNESKYITWAIYNNIIIGSFIHIIRALIGVPVGPDALYAIDFLYQQISVTGTLLLIFVPKFYAVYIGGYENEKITKTKTQSTFDEEDKGNLDHTDYTQTELTGEDIEHLLRQVDDYRFGGRNKIHPE